METRLIHDEAGEWLVNTGNYVMVDPETGCSFKPRTPTKAVKSEWVKGQPVIQPFVTEEATMSLATADTTAIATAQVEGLTTAAVAALTTAQVAAISSVELPKVK